jgi:cell division inhibitor SepF
MVFLGLGEDEPQRYVDDVPAYMDGEPSYDSSVALPPPVQEAPPRVKTLGPEDDLPRGAVVRSTATAERVQVVAPTGFNDAKEIGDHLKRESPVLMNLLDVDRDVRRRLVDFSSGLAYALGAKMERVGDNVFLLTPRDVEVSEDERRRMRESGLFTSGV